MNRIIAITLIAAAAAGSIGAETLTLTVDEAVEMAAAQNLSLKQAGITLRTAERAKDTAWNAFLPTMAASAGVSDSHIIFDHDYYSSSGFGDAGNFGIQAGLALSLPINIGLSSSIKKLQVDYQAGLLDYEDARKQLERDIQKHFYGLLANKENIRIQEANINLARKRLEQARNNYVNGLVPELEVLSAEVTVANLQPVYDSVVALYDRMFLAFKFLLGVNLNTEIELVGDLETELYDLETQALINSYLSGRLDLRSLQLQIQALELTKKSTARNFNTPTLNLGYTWGISGSNAEYLMGITDVGMGGNPVLGYSEISPWTDWADRGTLSLGLQWKFDGFIPGSSTDVTLKEIQDGIDSMNLAMEMAYENAGMEITNYVKSLATARKTIEATSSSVGLAWKNYQLTEEAYKVGTRELLDVESAQTDYLEASQQLLMAKYDYIAGLLDLEYALNAPRSEFLE